MQSLYCIFKETTLRFKNISTFGNESFLAQTADMVHICLFLKVRLIFKYSLSHKTLIRGV